MFSNLPVATEPVLSLEQEHTNIWHRINKIDLTTKWKAFHLYAQWQKNVF